MDSPPSVSRLEQLFLQREARGLQVPVVTRVLLALYALIALQSVDFPLPLLLGLTTFQVIVVGTNVVFLRLLRRGRAVHLVGVIGAGLDVLLLTLMPVLWMQTLGEHVPDRGYLLNTPLTLFSLVFIVINGMSCQPRYPLIVTVGVLLIHAVIIGLVAADPSVTWTRVPYEHLLKGYASPTIVANRVVVLMFVGAAVTWTTMVARRTIGDGMRLERKNLDLREQQARAVMEQKVAAYGRLVAGISHEINNPLGAIRSALDTTRRAADKLRPSDADGEPSARTRAKSLRAIDASTQVAEEAAARVGDTVGRLKRFARLDEAELQTLDVNAALETSLALVPEQVRGDAVVRVELEPLPQIQAVARELNQAFLTVLTNAFEAIDGAGTVSISSSHVSSAGRILIEIADTGRGIPARDLERLFDIDFSVQGDRVGAGLGLPAAQSVVLRHGGDVQVESEVGSGTRFHIELPV